MTRAALVVGVRKLGGHVAAALGAEGWRVFCAARTLDSAHAAAERVRATGAEAQPLVCDLTNPASLTALAERPLDLVVAAQASGGRFGARPMLDIDREELDLGLATYVRGTWNLLQAVGPGLVARRGAFVQVGSASALRPRAGFSALAAAQGALRGLLAATAAEWRPLGARATFVVIDGALDSPAVRARFGDQRPMVRPADVTSAIQRVLAAPSDAWPAEVVLAPWTGDVAGT